MSMTSNQIAYQNLLESRRAAIAKQEEINRSNRVNEAETRRSNIEREKETERHNIMSEVNQIFGNAGKVLPLLFM